MTPEAREAGFVVTSRKLQKHWLWRSAEPFDRRSAWQDLILTARFASNGELKRGQLRASVRYLSSRWKWPVPRVQRFLTLLRDDSMISVTSDGQEGQIITILNYNRYQGVSDTHSDTPTDTPKPLLYLGVRPKDDTPADTPTDTKQEEGVRSKDYKSLDLDAGAVGHSKVLVAAANRGIMNNRQILERSEPRLLRPEWEGSLAATQEITRAGVPAAFAVSVITPAAMAYRPTTKNPQPMSLRYFVRGVIEAWQAHQKAERERAATAHLPAGVRPLPESQRRRKAAPTSIGDILSKGFPGANQ